MFIKTASQQTAVIQHHGYRAFTQTALNLRWPNAGVRNLALRNIQWDKAKGEVVAQVWRSNWTVQCPFCAGAMFVEPGEPFFCPDCAMQGNDWLPMTVVWPKERQAIELILLKRDNPMNRNWLIGETVDDLIRENVEHGIAGV